MTETISFIRVVACASVTTFILLLSPSTALAESPKDAMARVLASDPRNAGLEMSASWESLLSSDAILVRLEGMTQPKSSADILRVLFQFAARMSDESRFKVVKLTRGHEVRFMVSGDYFREMGREYGAGQNPMYLTRTFPEHVYKTDGTPAFATWSGGLIGVTGRQMEDLNTLMATWVRE